MILKFVGTSCGLGLVAARSAWQLEVKVTYLSISVSTEGYKYLIIAFKKFFLFWMPMKDLEGLEGKIRKFLLFYLKIL